MNKDIILPSRRYIISQSLQNLCAAKITTNMAGISQDLSVYEVDLLPMACALIEIYGVIQADKIAWKEKVRCASEFTV